MLMRPFNLLPPPPAVGGAEFVVSAPLVHIPSAAALTQDTPDYTIVAGSGNGRLLVVEITCDSGQVNDVNSVAIVGGATLTRAAFHIDPGTRGLLVATYYATDAQLPAAANTDIAIRVTMAVSTAPMIRVRAFEGAEQTIPAIQTVIDPPGSNSWTLGDTLLGVEDGDYITAAIVGNVGLSDRHFHFATNLTVDTTALQGIGPTTFVASFGSFFPAVAPDHTYEWQTANSSSLHNECISVAAAIRPAGA